MFQIFMDVFQPTATTSVLDVGVTSDFSHAESNFFERLYPYPNQLTCVGTEDGSHLMLEYPGLRYLPVVSGQPLPFNDGQFDIVFSNAVLEHVGSRIEQARFVAELRRVSKAFFVTTPNRWFPVEHHTGLPFLHYLPPALFRGLIRNTRYRYWADEANLNILTVPEMAKLFPDAGTRIEIVRLLGIGSNLVAYGTS
jgi:SAM-dependent methyltransferase